MPTIEALVQLERVQQRQTSDFWQSRLDNPLLIANWPELALASTAWSWMDAEPQPPTAAVWKKLWDKAVAWPIGDHLAYVEQALMAWSDYPIWTSLRSTALIQAMEREQPRDWSSLMMPHDLQSHRFAYHLLHTVCLHPDKFEQVDLKAIRDLILNNQVLRSDLREILMVCLLSSSDDAWKRMTQGHPEDVLAGQVPQAWMQDFKAKLPQRASWFADFETMQANLGVTGVHRSVLASQWDIVLNKNQWNKQVQSYALFDFADAAPSLF